MLPVIPFNVSTQVTVVDNQLTLPAAGKFVVDMVAASPVTLAFYGPFVDANGNPTTPNPGGKLGLGKLAMAGTSVWVGHTFMQQGNYLVEIFGGDPPLTLLVRTWGFFDNILQFWYRFTRGNKF